MRRTTKMRLAAALRGPEVFQAREAPSVCAVPFGAVFSITLLAGVMVGAVNFVNNLVIAAQEHLIG